jgi:hypothetical protein
MKYVNSKSYVGMERMAGKRVDWRAAIKQSLDLCPAMMMSNERIV